MDEKIKVIDTILTTDKVPKYIKEIVKRLTPKLMEYKDEDFRITVLKVSERRIVKVRLTVLPEKEDR